MKGIVCPIDFCESGILEKIDEKGAHFLCTECGYTWCDSSVKIAK